MTAEEAARAAARRRRTRRRRRRHAAARAAGLELLRADNNSTGFRSVSRNQQAKPFSAKPGTSLGVFFTAEEAALAVARKLGLKGIAKLKAAEAAEPAPP